VNGLRYLYRNPRTFFLVFLGLVTAWNWLMPDIMPYNHGFGFEGYNIYKPLAKSLNLKSVNSYSIQRVLPYVMLNLGFRGSGTTFTDANMLGFFKGLHLLLGIAIIFTWDALARRLRTGLAGAWIGYLCLLVNFATLKHDLYIPFTYDRLALCSGLLSLYCYFSGRRLGLLLNALLALTIWPTAIAYNSVLLLFPADLKLPLSRNRALGTGWGALVAAGFGTLFISLIYVQHIPVPKHLAPAIRPLLPLSIAFACGYLFFVQRSMAMRLLPAFREFRPWLGQVLKPHWGWLGVALLFVAHYGLTHKIGDPTKTYLTPRQFAINFSYGALQRPAQFLVAHAVYYGLAAMILILFWRPALRALPRLGLGFGVVLLLALIQGTNNETRQLANVLPAFAILAALVARKLRLRPHTVAMTGIIAFVVSKCWLRLNMLSPDYGKPIDVFPMTGFAKDRFLEWPMQAYHMNFGPWTATWALLLQAGIISALSVVLHYSWTRAHRTAARLLLSRKTAPLQEPVG
jgi:hypothetical protein